ncbi:PNP-UDP-1 domain-containing protein [Fusarium falciforme]|uniref:PNP-UDP-1 domain-containing protein n=1 Tax=Fusarium falciforme TaxID=195108 RepID=UPI00230026C4|nr:PNP-UDP-1 domain-containing protein [Fusarium falciforme]WAO84617.1 PNP-UDP-1 domain-containing protein [Fusarium falciforme]
MSETSLVTSEPNLIDRDSKIRCPSGADLLDDTPFEFTEIGGGSGGSSQQILNRYDLQWSSSEFETLLKLPKELSHLAAEEWSSKQEEISKATYTTPNTATSDPILMHFRSRKAPESRDDFQIAIACSLSLEYDAVCHLVDDFWDKDYGRTASDPNMYRNGRIGAFNIVIVLLYGKRIFKATSATASLRSSYPNLELVLVTGICGGVPKTGEGKELVLGDVVISNTVVQYDLGRRYPDGFETKNTLNDSLGRPALHIQNLVVTFKTRRGLQLLEQQSASHLEKLQSQQSDGDAATHYEYPGAGNDHLYPTSYVHKHYSTEVCRECNSGPGVVCAVSRNLSCRELGCDAQQRVPRKRLQDSERVRVPRVLVGHLGWGDRVLKSGEDRDRIAKEHDLIAFGMEEAGAWDGIPCIIVQGICDYADSHKNKHWQNFAAATAASVAKALVEEYPRTDKPSNSRQQESLEDDPSEDESTSYSVSSGGDKESVSDIVHRIPSSDACHVLAYDRNENFVPRPGINSKLDQLLPSNSDEFQSAALWGLGGSGKTQVALQYAYGRCRNPDCSVFWVHADTEATFTQDYNRVADALGLGSFSEGSELLRAVRSGIESQKRWLLVLDNADDLGLFGVGPATGHRGRTLSNYIPKGPSGAVLWTSRDQQVDGSLVEPQHGIEVPKMTAEESRNLLEIWRRQVTPNEEIREVELLLEELQWLPLAISQAGAYLYKTDTSVTEYLSQLRQETERWRVLGEDEFDKHRRSDAQNSVLRTWSISIHRLKQENQTTYKILHTLAFLHSQEISMELLVEAARYNWESQSWTTQEVEALNKAVQRLQDFSFITKYRGAENRQMVKMHKLVQDAARYGLNTQKSPGQGGEYFARLALLAVDRVYARNTWPGNSWQGNNERYLAHALRVCGWTEIQGMEGVAYNLQGQVCRFLSSRGRWEELRLAAETQLRLAQRGFGEKDRRSIQALLNLGWTFINLEQPQEVEECAKQTMALAQETLGDHDLLTLDCKRLFGLAAAQQGRSKQAKELLMEILGYAETFLTARHDLILDCMHDLARAHLQLNEHDEAEELLSSLMKKVKARYGQGHPRSFQVLSHFGNLYYRKGRIDEAVKVQSRLLDFHIQSLGSQHPDTLIMMYNLAWSRRLQGQKEEALELMQECSRLRHAILGAEHPHTKCADEAIENWEREDREADKDHQHEGTEVDEDSGCTDMEMDKSIEHEEMEVDEAEAESERNLVSPSKEGSDARTIFVP